MSSVHSRHVRQIRNDKRAAASNEGPPHEWEDGADLQKSAEVEADTNLSRHDENYLEMIMERMAADPVSRHHMRRLRRATQNIEKNPGSRYFMQEHQLAGMALVGSLEACAFMHELEGMQR